MGSSKIGLPSNEAHGGIGSSILEHDKDVHHELDYLGNKLWIALGEFHPWVHCLMRMIWKVLVKLQKV